MNYPGILDCNHFQNTSGEIKFALRVENELNKIVYPEYRQLVVELLMVFHVFLERDSKLSMNGIVQLDSLVKNANQLFLDEQVFLYNLPDNILSDSFQNVEILFQ